MALPEAEAGPFTNWLRAWKQVPRRRVAWMGGITVLVLALATGAVLLGTINGAKGFLSPTSGPKSTETVTVLVEPASPAQVVVGSTDGVSFGAWLPAGVFEDPHTLTIGPVSLTEVPEIQAEARGNLEVLSAYEVRLFGEQGKEIVYPELRQGITIKATYSGQELFRAGNDSSRLTIFWLNASNRQWETLPTNVDPATQTLTTEVRHLSIFAIGIQFFAGPTVTSTPTPILTPTPTPGPASTPTPTVVPAPTAALTLTATPTATPAVTPTPTRTPVPLPTLPPTPTMVPTPTPTAVPIPSPTPTSTSTPVPTPTPVAQVFVRSVRFVSGNLEGRKIKVPVGSMVEVVVTLFASAPTRGNLEVEVRKDLGFGVDYREKLCFFQNSFGRSTEEVRGCSFVADELTVGFLPQYFVWVYWNGSLIYDPRAAPAARPEYVLTSPLPPPTPTPTRIAAYGYA
ncbi:MAG: hypothetical protein V3S37_00800 [Dehalococcoidia bacterium]